MKIGVELIMKITIVFAILLLFLSSAMAATAEQSRPELGKWWKNSEVVRNLQLSEGQVDRIEGIFLDFRPVLANLNTELKDREEGLRALMNKEPIDESRIQSQTELIAQSRTALEKANSSMMLAIRKELSKEQWEKLEDIREYRRGSPMVLRAPPRGPVAEAHSGQDGEKVYAVREGVVAPTVLYQPLPSYTVEARDAKVEGIILMEGVIRKNGRVTDVKILRGLGYGLDQKAIDILTKEWRFAPGTLNGQPVNVQARIEISFRRY